MTTHADETRAAAANIEHPWDERALDWPLNKESVVIDVGGYKGRWALQIMERYHPRLYVFEPQTWAADVCREVLGGVATVEPYGLGVEDGYLPLGQHETDGCSFLKEDGNQSIGQIKDIGVAFQDLGIAHIDLMMMNIEGYEYTLIPHMLDRRIFPRRLMVQFHTFADPKGEALTAIHERMAAAGYTIPWTYGLMLTAWEREKKEEPPASPRRKPGRKPKAGE